MTTSLQGVQLCSRKVLQHKTYSVTIEEETGEETNSIPSSTSSLPNEDNIPISQNQCSPQPKQPQIFKEPPYLERLALEKPIVQP